MPQTLTGVLQARLDGLPPAERLALQQASVIGLVFWDQALAALDARAPEALPALVRRELTLPRPDAALDDVREYAFSHQILHQRHLRHRAQAHAGANCTPSAAAWLAGQTGARASDFLGAAAEHYEMAGDSLQACEYFTRAAEHAKSRFAHEAALGHVGRALALLDREPATSPAMLALRWRLLDVRELMLDLQGRRAEQRSALDAMQPLADALDDDRRRA